MRIVVAMSGGVDSSVAAALLVEQGHDVIGLSMQLYDQEVDKQKFGGCCSIEDLHDARRTAATLGIPHYLMNFERQFNDSVVSAFVREYAIGRTPIPCVHCNSDLKFTHLLDRAKGLGAEAVATGHYARIDRASDPDRVLLQRGADPSKDQSYFLFTLTPVQLSRVLFPVGDLDKHEVRVYAQERGLPVANKPDSQELCFIPDGDTGRFIEERQPTVSRTGPIYDTLGKRIGTHGGIHRFTVGQRKGLGLSNGVPLYVLKIDPNGDALTVGSRTEMERRSLTASAVNWIVPTPPGSKRRVTARLRHRHPDTPASVRSLTGQRAHVVFDEPQSAVAPGQAVVFYDRDIVVGGGWID